MLCIIQMTILVKESSFYMIFTSWHCTPCFRPSWFQRPAPAWFNMPLALFTGTRMRTINSKPVYLTVSFLDNHILLHSNICWHSINFSHLLLVIWYMSNADPQHLPIMHYHHVCVQCLPTCWWAIDDNTFILQLHKHPAVYNTSMLLISPSALLYK